MKRNDLASLIMIAATVTFLAFSQRANGQEQPNDVAWQRYVHILSDSTLEWASSQPFLLKADFQLYDLAGNPVEKGTAEESWTEADGRRIHIESPSLVEGDTPPVDEFKIHTREDYLVRQAIQAFVRPFPVATQHKDFAIDEFHQMLGDVELGCFSLVRPGETRTAIEPGYCTDADNHIVAMTGQLFVLERSDFRKSRSHEIPMDLKLSYEGRLALTMHVIELDPLPAVPVSNSKTAASSLVRTGIPADTMAGHILKKKDPSYPKEAKKKRIMGSVLLAAIITKQGTIGGLDVIASPDPLLSRSALDAVRTWTYQPYLLKGAPAEVDTTITVNFSMGSR